MNVEITQAVWLHECEDCTLDDLSAISGLTRDELEELVATGLLQPAAAHATNPRFRAECVIVARTARRLRDDFELDRQGLTVAVSLLGRIRALEAELNALRAALGAQA